jgi:hypothetical protein
MRKMGGDFIFAKCRAKFFPRQSYKSCRACVEGYPLVDCGFNLEVNVILEIWLIISTTTHEIKGVIASERDPALPVRGIIRHQHFQAF